MNPVSAHPSAQGFPLLSIPKEIFGFIIPKLGEQHVRLALVSKDMLERCQPAFVYFFEVSNNLRLLEKESLKPRAFEPRLTAFETNNRFLFPDHARKLLLQLATIARQLPPGVATETILNRILTNGAELGMDTSLLATMGKDSMALSRAKQAPYMETALLKQVWSAHDSKSIRKRAEWPLIPLLEKESLPHWVLPHMVECFVTLAGDPHHAKKLFRFLRLHDDQVELLKNYIGLFENYLERYKQASTSLSGIFELLIAETAGMDDASAADILIKLCDSTLCSTPKDVCDLIDRAIKIRGFDQSRVVNALLDTLEKNPGLWSGLCTEEETQQSAKNFASLLDAHFFNPKLIKKALSFVSALPGSSQREVLADLPDRFRNLDPRLRMGLWPAICHLKSLEFSLARDMISAFLSWRDLPEAACKKAQKLAGILADFIVEHGQAKENVRLLLELLKLMPDSRKSSLASEITWHVSRPENIATVCAALWKRCLSGKSKTASAPETNSSQGRWRQRDYDVVSLLLKLLPRAGKSAVRKEAMELALVMSTANRASKEQALSLVCDVAFNYRAELDEGGKEFAEMLDRIYQFEAKDRHVPLGILARRLCVNGERAHIDLCFKAILARSGIVKKTWTSPLLDLWDSSKGQSKPVVNGGEPWLRSLLAMIPDVAQGDRYFINSWCELVPTLLDAGSDLPSREKILLLGKILESWTERLESQDIFEDYTSLKLNVVKLLASEIGKLEKEHAEEKHRLLLALCRKIDAHLFRSARKLAGKPLRNAISGLSEAQTKELKKIADDYTKRGDRWEED